MNERTLLEIFRKIIKQETIWLRHYYAKIVNVNDPLRLGRVKVVCYDIGYNTAETGIWCNPRDKNGLTTLKQNDWVEIYFMNGDRNVPVYIGRVTEMSGMLPKNYKKKNTSNVIYEDPNNKIHISYDSSKNEMEIGNSDLKFVARIDDSVKLNLTGIDIQTLATALLATTAFVPSGSPPVPGPPVTITGGSITSGSNQLKAGKK